MSRPIVLAVLVLTGLAFSIVAVDDDQARTPWPISLTIADDRLFTAWSAGMGSVWPDCDVVVAPGFEVRDLDGDGNDDVVFRRILGEDGTTEASVMLQRGTLKFVEAAKCMSCSPEPDIAADGTRLLILEDDCCCMLTVTALRLSGDYYHYAGDWSVPSSCTANPDDATTITFERDARSRITGLVEQPAKGAARRWRWQGRGFDPVAP